MFNTLLAIWGIIQPFINYIVVGVLIVLAFLAGLTQSGIAVAKKIGTFLGAVFTFIQTALSENGGGPSSKRLQNFFATVLLVPTMAFTMIHVALHKPELIISVLTIISGLVTLLLGLQVAGKKDEIKDPNNAPDKPAGTP
jgi:F0F1-type ATP synthase membrane subunit a